MKYSLIVRKLNSIEDRFITADRIKEYCSVLEMEYYDAIIYLTRHKHLYTILKGIFYKPSVAERKLKSLKIDHYEAIAKALGLKGINWYFGLETAIKFNNITHEFFAVDYIINDKIGRTLKILGNKVKMVKLKPELLDFGIKKSNGFRYSDVEKTVLDIVYLKRYRGIKEENIANFITPLIKYCSKEKLKHYAKRYNKKMEEFVSERTN